MYFETAVVSPPAAMDCPSIQIGITILQSPISEGDIILLRNILKTNPIILQINPALANIKVPLINLFTDIRLLEVFFINVFIRARKKKSFDSG